MPSNSKTLMITATTVGSLVEMYDFGVYALFATIIASLFFPKSDGSVALVETFGIFAAGYLARPLGGVIFGHVCDKVGRKNGLLISIIMMGIPLLIMACLPTYQSIGHAAPILLLICRVIQGLSVGGEFPNATTFLAEHANPLHRGFICSLAFFGINLGIVVASGISTWISHALSTPALYAYGWRLAFLIGAVLAILSYFIRTRLAETPAFETLQRQHQVAPLPFLQAFKTHPWRLLQSFGVVVVMAAAISTVSLFMPAYLTHYVHLPINKSLFFNTLNVFIFSCLIPLTAWLSDRSSRKLILLIGSLLFVLTSYPLYHLIQQGTDASVLTGMIGLAIATAFCIGPIAATLAERFSTASRATSIAISYNFSFAIFGGLAPFLITLFGFWLHNPANGAAGLLTITGIISFVFIVSLPFDQSHTTMLR